MKATDITSSDWSLSLKTRGEIVQGVSSINQRMDVLLKTPKGNDALRGTFGCDVYQKIDKNIPSLAACKAEIVDAIETWMTDITLTKVTYSINVSQVTFYILYSINGTELEGSNNINFTI
jgi:phage baseplate assembly protein W